MAGLLPVVPSALPEPLGFKRYQYTILSANEMGYWDFESVENLHELCWHLGLFRLYASM